MCGNGREVRPWSVTATARRYALAGCSSAGAVQAGGDGPPLSGTASPVVSRRLLRAGLHGSWSPASAIRQSPSTHRFSRPSQHFRRSCFRHCGPNSLEFSAGQFAWSSCWAWSVSTWLENASIWVTQWHCVSFSALAVFSRNALYKSTFYLLTYRCRIPIWRMFGRI